jgi:outer membrane protein
MNFLKHSTKYFMLAALLIAAASCGSKQDNKPSNLPKDATGQLVIRYVDEDSLLAKYNLAKDINEAMLRRQNQYDAAQQQRQNEINRFGTAMQQKYKSNGYLNEESFKADQAKLQKMQSDAQSYIGNLQQSIQNEMNQNSQQLSDSISSYLKTYAKEKGYDAVLRKTATFYIDPKYDITKDVIEGLNKRYNKVEKK